MSKENVPKTHQDIRQKNSPLGSIIIIIAFLMGGYALLQLFVIIAVNVLGAYKISQTPNTKEGLLNDMLISSLPHLLWYVILFLVAIGLIRFSKRFKLTNDALSVTEKPRLNPVKSAPNEMTPRLFSYGFVVLGIFLLGKGLFMFAQNLGEMDSWFLDVAKPIFPWLCSGFLFLFSGWRLLISVNRGEFNPDAAGAFIVPDWSAVSVQKQTNLALLSAKKSDDKFFKPFLRSLFFCSILGAIWQVIPIFVLGIFLIPSVLYFLYSLPKIIVLFNPNLDFVLHEVKLQAGKRATFNWRINGAAQRLKNLNIELIGQEKVTYEYGSTTKDEEQDFYQKSYAISASAIDQGQGVLTVEIPSNTMHTLHSSHNKIIWLLRVKSDISMGMNLEEDYEITVYP